MKIEIGSLRNFYNKDENLLESVDPRIRQKLSTRLAFLVLNHGEVIYNYSYKYM